MNTIPTKILTGFLNSSNLCKTLIIGFLLVPFASIQAQQSYHPSFPSQHPHDGMVGPPGFFKKDTTAADSVQVPRDFPKPKSVLFKSLMIPGWGQVVNKQAWKVPIVYGLLGGLVWYSMDLTEKYHDYRAAYYNATSEEDDMRFGPTPGYISPATSPDELRNSRNRFRNRRDFIYIAMGLAYGLNAIDAYVFAHMRSFDVSDDLSIRTGIKPAIFDNSTPGITLSVKLYNRSKTR